MTRSTADIKYEAKSIIFSRGYKVFIVAAVLMLVTFVLSYLIETLSGAGQVILDYYDALKAGKEYVMVWPKVSALSWVICALVYVMLIMVSAGYSFHLLAVMRGEEISVRDLTASFEHFGRALAVVVLRSLLIGAGTMLFIIPGLILSYRYRMALYVLYDNPELGPVECLRRSGELMRGNKLSLLILDISFIGWYFLSGLISAVALPVLDVWLRPYTGVAEVIFYRDIAYPQPEDDVERIDLRA